MSTGVKISALPNTASLMSSDIFPLVTGGVTRRAAFSMLPFSPMGSGATLRTISRKLGDVVSVKDFGAVGDDSTDDTAAINKAVVAAANGALYFPSGIYKTTAKISVASPVVIYGDGRAGTTIKAYTAGQDVFEVTTASACIFRDFKIDAGATKTAGAGIAFNVGGATYNSGSLIDNVQIGLQYNGIYFEEAATFTLRSSYIVNSVNYGVIVDNTADVDAGDSTITGCTFDSSNTASLGAILQLASGGLRITNNKILRHQYGMRLVPTNGVATSILLMSGNSFEHQKIAAIEMTKSGTVTFYHVMIGNNQFNMTDPTFWGGSVTPTGIVQSVAGWMNYVSVVGNHFQLGADGGTCISLTDVTLGTIEANTLIGGTGTTRVGITLGAGCASVKIGDQNFYGLTTNISNAAATTQRPGSVVLAMGGGNVSTPADTTEDALVSVTIPARLMGVNGSIRVRMSFVMTNGANDKTMRVRYSTISGTAFFATLQTTADYVTVDLIITNRGATNSQIGQAIALTNAPAAIAPINVTGAIDTTADTTLIITGQKEIAGETLTLTNHLVELIPS